MPPNTRRSKVVVFLVILAMLLGIGVGGYAYYKHQQAKQDTAPSSSGIARADGAIPPGLKITRTAQAPKLEAFPQASPAFHITAKQEPSGNMTLTFPLHKGEHLQPGEMYILATTDRTGKWQAKPYVAKVSADGTTATVTLPAEGVQLAAGQPAMQLAAFAPWDTLVSLVKISKDALLRLVQEFTKQYGDVFSDSLAATAKRPTCRNEAAAKANGDYRVNWFGKYAGLIAWCMGADLDASGNVTRRYVIATNLQHYPLDVRWTNGLQLSEQPAWQLDFKRLARALVRKNDAVLFGGESLTFTVSMQSGGKAQLSTRFSGFAWSAYNLDLAAQVLSAIYAKTHGGKGFKVGVKELDTMLENQDCINAVIEANPKATLLHCIYVKVFDDMTDKLFGLVVQVLTIGNMAAVSIIGGSKGLVDSLQDKDRYSIVITRKAAPARTLPEVCGWINWGTQSARQVAVLAGSVSCGDAKAVVKRFIAEIYEGPYDTEEAQQDAVIRFDGWECGFNFVSPGTGSRDGGRCSRGKDMIDTAWKEY